MTACNDIQQQTISEIQLRQLVIEWRPYVSIKPNKYNPNKMTWHDRLLLRTSLLEDGWTQPIVVLPDGTIVDGEQRWTTAQTEVSSAEVQEMLDKMALREQEGYPQSESIRTRLQDAHDRLAKIEQDEQRKTLMADITGGHVPITVLDLGDDAHKMISTIRHNRARGSHQIDRMADITSDLMQLGLDIDDLEQRLGMDDDEIQRMLSTAEQLIEQALENTDDYSASWQPVNILSLPERKLEEIGVERTLEVDEQRKEYEVQQLQRQQQIQAEVEIRVAALEEQQKIVTQDIKDKIRAEVQQQVAKIQPPPSIELKAIKVFITPEQHTICKTVFDRFYEGRDAIAIVSLCEFALAHTEELESWLSNEVA